jgi:hypothetical protein
VDAPSAVSADAPRAVGNAEPTAFRGTIVALGGGGFSTSETGASAIDDELVRMAARRIRAGTEDEAGAQSGFGASVGLPHVCFVPTASGDSRDYIERFEAAFEASARTYVLSLFGQSPWDYQDPAMLLDMDLIYVGGGSTANLLSLWRRHGVDELMKNRCCRRHDPRWHQRRSELLVRRLLDGFVRSVGTVERRARISAGECLPALPRRTRAGGILPRLDHGWESARTRNRHR